MNSQQKESWRKLFDISKKINKLKPWQFVSETQLFIVHLPNHTQPIVITVLGEYNQPGLLMYPTAQSQKILANTLYDSIDIVDPLSHRITQKDTLACYFGNREDLSKEDYELVKSLDLNPRGNGNWLKFIKFQAGTFPQSFGENDVALLGQSYDILYAGLKELQLTENSMHEFTHFYLNETSITISHEEYRLYEENGLTPEPFKNDVLIHRLNYLNRSSITLELTYFYTNQLDDDHNVIAMIIGVDADLGSIYFFDFSHGPQNVHHDIFTQLAQFFKLTGRPKQINVRLEDLSCVLDDFCQRLDIKLVTTPDLDELDLACISLLEVL